MKKSVRFAVPPAEMQLNALYEPQDEDQDRYAGFIEPQYEYRAEYRDRWNAFTQVHDGGQVTEYTKEYEDYRPASAEPTTHTQPYVGMATSEMEVYEEVTNNYT